MGLDLWFRPDVARIIASKAQAASRLDDSSYREGYMDALGDVAVAFGFVPVQVMGGVVQDEGQSRELTRLMK